MDLRMEGVAVLEFTLMPVRMWCSRRDNLTLTITILPRSITVKRVCRSTQVLTDQDKTTTGCKQIVGRTQEAWLLKSWTLLLSSTAIWRPGSEQRLRQRMEDPGPAAMAELLLSMPSSNLTRQMLEKKSMSKKSFCFTFSVFSLCFVIVIYCLLTQHPGFFEHLFFWGNS